MTVTSSGAVFELLDAVPEGAADVLGLWVATPSMSDNVAFETPAAPPPAAVWRVALPANPFLAAASLSGAAAVLEASRQSLVVADDRLRAFVQAASEDVAFDLPLERAATGRPEAILFAALREAEPSDDVAIGPGDRPGRWEHAAEQFRAFLRRVGQALAHYAWVETYVGDRRLGWSVVGWSGNVSTVWQAGFSPGQMALHQSALALALASRATLLRMLVLAARGAMLLASAVATPLGPLLALPAAWRFVDAVLAERRQQGGQP